MLIPVLHWKLHHANLLLIVHDIRNIKCKHLALDFLLFTLGKNIMPRLRHANRDGGGVLVLRRRDRILPELRTPTGLTAYGRHGSGSDRSKDSKT
jgi:hypothetical protein